MTNRGSRFKRERETLQSMIRLACRGRHGTGEALCDVCSTLEQYALSRLESCRFGDDKPKCSECPVHCYKPAMRQAIREVMRYAGPRMPLRHPVLAVGHVMDGLLNRPPVSVAGVKP